MQVPLGRLAEHARIEDLAHEAGQREGLGHGLFAPAERARPTWMYARCGALSLMIRTRRTCMSARFSSPSSSAAWVTADSGLRISCAMLAVRRPSADDLQLALDLLVVGEIQQGVTLGRAPRSPPPAATTPGSADPHERLLPALAGASPPDRRRGRQARDRRCRVACTRRTGHLFAALAWRTRPCSPGDHAVLHVAQDVGAHRLLLGERHPRSA